MIKVEIPEQLKQKEFRFIKIRPESKLPMEKGWQTTNNYKFNNEHFLNSVQHNSMYGVATGYGGVVVIDCDYKMMESIVDRELPETFKVRTPSGGSHHYYLSDIPKTILLKHPVLEDEKEAPLHLGEIRSTGSQVIGPNSHNVKKGKSYIVEKDIALTPVKGEIILEKLKRYLYQKHFNVTQMSKEKEEFLNRIDLKDVLSKYGVDVSRYPTKCPWHTCKGAGNFGFDNKLWHCFHCLKGGTAIHFIQIVENVDYFEALDILKTKFMKQR